MEKAYNVVMGRIEYAYQIKHSYPEHYAEVHKDNFVCSNPRCAEKATTVACALGRIVNGIFEPYVKAPHFKVKNHITGCHFDKSNGCKVKDDGNGRTVVEYSHVGEILPPNEPEETNYRQVGSQQRRHADTANSKSGPRSNRRRSNSIASAVLFYIQSPKQNSVKPLSINYKQKTYRSYFQQITGAKNIRFNDDFLFYKELRFTQPPIVSENMIKLTLNQKDPVTDEFFELHLNTARWKENIKEGVLREINIGYQEARRRLEGECVTVFFIGKQDGNSSNVFHCEYAEYFFMYIGQKFALQFNMFGTRKIAVDPLPEVRDEGAYIDSIADEFIDTREHNELVDNSTQKVELIEVPMHMPVHDKKKFIVEEPVGGEEAKYHEPMPKYDQPPKQEQGLMKNLVGKLKSLLWG